MNDFSIAAGTMIIILIRKQFKLNRVHPSNRHSSCSSFFIIIYFTCFFLVHAHVKRISSCIFLLVVYHYCCSKKCKNKIDFCMKQMKSCTWKHISCKSRCLVSCRDIDGHMPNFVNFLHKWSLCVFSVVRSIPSNFQIMYVL